LGFGVNFLPDWESFFFAIMEDPCQSTFRCGKTALWGLVKMDKKEEWDKLDVISKWLIATPFCRKPR